MHALLNRKLMLWSVSLFLLLVGAGCLEVEQEISLSSGNRGTFRIFISVPIRVYEQFAKDEKVPLLAARFFDPEKGRIWFTDAPGLKLTKYRVFDHEDRFYAQIEGKITDVQKAFASGRLGKFKLTEKPDKTQRLELVIAQPPGFKAQPQMAKLAAGCRFALKLKVPGNVTASSATKKEAKSAFWSFEASKNADFLQKPPSIYVEYK